MTEIARKRCRNHSGREAVAKCPVCTNFFCRECITEHEDRVLCSTCLAEEAGGSKNKTRKIGLITGPVKFIAGFVLIWFCFYLLGSLLLKLPASFHEGTLWHNLWWK